MSATCPIREPSPGGQRARVEAFYGFMPPDQQTDDIRVQTEIFDGAPVIAPIADCPFGCMLAIKCAGEDAGAVYFFDGEQRFFWPDAQFRTMFESLHPDIEHYLELRRQRKLPKKPRGYENFYRVADSFEQFLESCRPVEDEVVAAVETPRWCLVDGWTELACGETWPELEKAIRSIAEDCGFASHLNAYVELSPPSPASWSLHFGIASRADGDNLALAEPLACLSLVDPERLPAAATIVGDPNLLAAAGQVTFRREDGTPVTVASRNCVTVATLLDIVRRLLATGQPPATTRWETAAIP